MEELFNTAADYGEVLNKDMRFDYLKKSLFIVLPLFYLALSCIFLTGIKQFYISNYDSAYAYLLNGTNIASGHLNIGNIIHPGTPVDIFAAIVIFIKHLFSGNTILYQDVLLHPESYLFTCSVLLAFLLSFITYFAGTYVYSHSGNIAVALLFQMAPLFYNEMVGKTILLGAESGITISGIFFIAYLYSNTMGSSPSPNRKAGYKNDIVFGIFTALLITTKIYCAPVILLVLPLLKKKKEIIVYLLSSGIASLVLLFPLYSESRNWAGTIKGMIFHSGAYGQGNARIIDMASYLNNISSIFTAHYLFSLVYILSVAIFIAGIIGYAKKRIHTSNYVLPGIGILLFFTLFTLIIAKQYIIIYPEPLTHQVIKIYKYYYFIPLIVCFPFVISISYQIFSPAVESNLFIRPHKQQIWGGLLILFIICSGVKLYATCYGARYQDVSIKKTRPFLGQYKNIPLILVSDGSKVCIEPALFLGISYSGEWGLSEYMPWVKKEYPNTYLYATYDDALIFWGGPADISTILRENRQALVYISGTDSTTEVTILSRISDGMIQKNEVTCSKIYSSENKYEDIYLLKADTSH